MSIEGLNTILDKKEVVPTFSVQDLIDRPAQVEADYLYHVRTYVPVNRAAEAKESQISVEEFEKRLIKQVKEGRVPRGYITAGYGYGKTTTALYLWQRAQDSNIVIVPPFTLSDLPDFLHAVYGWLRYKLGQTRPALIESLNALYHGVIDTSLERISVKYNLTQATAASLLNEGRLVLELRANDYINFFEQATQIARDAGYDGLVVLPDEIQQYFRPKMKEGGDPIAPFFNIIQLLNTRAAATQLHFGFVMIITLEELSQIRDTFRRNDLLHRMNDLKIDLTSLYDSDFAPNLWRLMAKQFNFEAERDRIVHPETLEALGEISARSDISDGPRTVINVFSRMVRRFVESNGSATPYTPIDLTTDFLDEQAITFAGNDKLRRVLRRALESQIVRDHYEHFAPAIKLAAAYPTNGASRKIQERYGQTKALDELMRRAIGDLVQAGLQGEGAIRLTGLAQERERTAWLPSTVREFRLGYSEYSDVTRERAEETFIALLKERIFNRWKVIEDRERNFAVNRGLVFEGTFDVIKAKYPRRRVHVRLLWGDEKVKDANVDGDVCLEYQLILPLSDADDMRRAYAGELPDPDDRTARIKVNLLHHKAEYIPQNLQKEFEDVWSPYDLSPLVLMNIYALIEEKRRENSIPKQDDQLIQKGIQPAILDTVTKALFNAELGGPVNAAGVKITEQIVGFMLEARYPEYKPLVMVQNWNALLDKYKNALGKLEHPLQRTGDMELDGTKAEVGELLMSSNTGFDSFLRSFPDLLMIVREFGRGNASGTVRFTLHPMEREIVKALLESDRVVQVERKGKSIGIHQVSIKQVMRDAMAKGYLEEEVNALLELLKARGLVEASQGWLSEIVNEDVDLDAVRQLYRKLNHALDTLSEAYRDSTQLKKQHQFLTETLFNTLQTLNRQNPPDPKESGRLASGLRRAETDLQHWVTDEVQTLVKALGNLSVEKIPPRMMDTFSTPLDAPVEYVDKVNWLRAQLEDKVSKVVASLNKHNNDVTEAQKRLQQGDVSAEQLANQKHALNALESSAHDLRQQRKEIETLYSQYMGWKTLIDDGVRFSNAIKHRQGALYDELGNAFAKLSTDIRGEISSHRLESLDKADVFSQQLKQLQTKADQQVREQRHQFDTFQSSLLDALSRYNLAKKDDWKDIQFNPEDFEGSQASVVTRGLQLLHDATQRVDERINKKRQLLDTVEHRMHDLPGTVRVEIENAVSSLAPESDELRFECMEINEEIKKTTADNLLERLPQLAKRIHLVRQQEADWSKRVDQIDDQLGKATPTAQELALLDLMQNTVDELVNLKQAFAQNEDVFWATIRSLYAKNFLRIRVQRMDEA